MALNALRVVPRNTKHVFVFTACKQNLSSQFFDLDIENRLDGGGTAGQTKNPHGFAHGPIELFLLAV